MACLERISISKQTFHFQQMLVVLSSLTRPYEVIKRLAPLSVDLEIVNEFHVKPERILQLRGFLWQPLSTDLSLYDFGVPNFITDLVILIDSLAQSAVIRNYVH